MAKNAEQTKTFFLFRRVFKPLKNATTAVRDRRQPAVQPCGPCALCAVDTSVAATSVVVPVGGVVAVQWRWCRWCGAVVVATTVRRCSGRRKWWNDLWGVGDGVTQQWNMIYDDFPRGSSRNKPRVVLPDRGCYVTKPRSSTRIPCARRRVSNAPAIGSRFSSDYCTTGALDHSSVTRTRTACAQTSPRPEQFHSAFRPCFLLLGHRRPVSYCTPIFTTITIILSNTCITRLI